MSLYNNVRDSLMSKGVIATLESGVGAGIKVAGDTALAKLGGGKVAQTVVNAASNAGAQAAKQAISKAIPYHMRAKLDAGSRVAGGILTGDYEGAAISAIEGGFFDGVLSSLGGSARESAGQGKVTPMLGGVSLRTARQIHQEVINAKHARKNLFVLEVASLSEGDMSQVFNMLAVDVDYEPFNIASDKQRMGGSVLDFVFGQEPCEMRLNTFDDAQGTLKNFFARHHAATAARDGTVGVPANFGIRIKVIHGVVAGGNSVSTAYADEGYFRVATLGHSQSRREQALQELQVSFSQLDTFMKP